jgi:hypothetical protein
MAPVVQNQNRPVTGCEPLDRLVVRLFVLLLPLVGGWLAYGSGWALVTDAYFASRAGQAWFFDVASRIALPFTELGVVGCLMVLTVASRREIRTVVKRWNVAVWVCFFVNFGLYVWDHPGFLIGIP